MNEVKFQDSNEVTKKLEQYFKKYQPELYKNKEYTIKITLWTDDDYMVILHSGEDGIDYTITFWKGIYTYTESKLLNVKNRENLLKFAKLGEGV